MITRKLLQTDKEKERYYYSISTELKNETPLYYLLQEIMKEYQNNSGHIQIYKSTSPKSLLLNFEYVKNGESTINDIEKYNEIKYKYVSSATSVEFNHYANFSIILSKKQKGY